LPTDFPPLPADLLQELKEIGKRTPIEKVKNIILRLCSIKPLRIPELVNILQRDADHLRKTYISKMVDDEELEYVFPESLHHPQQAYKTKAL
jgi:ATP-dependent DNA helicase RecG